MEEFIDLHHTGLLLDLFQTLVPHAACASARRRPHKAPRTSNFAISPRCSSTFHGFPKAFEASSTCSGPKRIQMRLLHPFHASSPRLSLPDTQRHASRRDLACAAPSQGPSTPAAQPPAAPRPFLGARVASARCDSEAAVGSDAPARGSRSPWPPEVQRHVKRRRRPASRREHAAATLSASGAQEPKENAQRPWKFIKKTVGAQ